MGSYCYLINEEKKISVEAYKYNESVENMQIEEPKDLIEFLDYCRENKLEIKCVHDSAFEFLEDLEIGIWYTDWNHYKDSLKYSHVIDIF